MAAQKSDIEYVNLAGSSLSRSQQANPDFELILRVIGRLDGARSARFFKNFGVLAPEIQFFSGILAGCARNAASMLGAGLTFYPAGMLMSGSVNART